MGDLESDRDTQIKQGETMYTSNATWSKIPKTTDTHDTIEQARVVCEILLDDYGWGEGCDIRGRCTAAWTEEVEDEV